MIYLLFSALAFLQALVMRRLGNIWYIAGRRVVATPYYSAWGIGWVITVFLLTGRLNWGQYWEIWRVFMVCFPFIIWGAQGVKPKSNGTTSEVFNAIDRRLSQLVDDFNQLKELVYG